MRRLFRGLRIISRESRQISMQMPVNRIAEELERLGRQDELEQAGPLLEQLETEMVRLREYMVGLGVKLSA